MDLPRVLLIIGNIGPGEIMFILLVVLLLFGAQKIPELARSLGKAQREFNRARQELEEEPRPAPRPEDDRLRKAAQDLGIDPAGKSSEDLRKAIAEKVKTP